LRLENVCKSITVLAFVRCEHLTHNGLVVLATVDFRVRTKARISRLFVKWNEYSWKFFLLHYLVHEIC